MLRLKKIKFNNIGRFVKEQTIDMTELSRLVEIEAINENTGGSSGSGKSTVFNVIDYILNINDIPATALQTRLTKDPMYAEGIFEVDGKDLIVNRSKKNGLTIQYGDESVSGNVKMAEERLDQIIGIPRKLFKKMVHKKQKEGGFFLNLTAKESYQFLMNALGLSDIGKKTDKIDENIKKLSSKVSELQNKEESLTMSREEIVKFSETNVKPTENKALPKKVETIASNLDKVNKKLESLSEEMQDKLSDLVEPTKQTYVSLDEGDAIDYKVVELKSKEKMLGDVILTKNTELSKIDDEISDTKKLIDEIPFYKQKMEDMISNMKKLMEQKEKISSNVCSTCSQTWVGEGAESKIKEINSHIAMLKKDIISSKEKVDSLPNLNLTINNLTSNKSNIESKYDLDTFRADISKVEHELIELRASFSNKQSEYDNKYLTELNTYKTQYSETQQKYQKEISELTSQKHNLSTELNDLKHTLQIYESVLAKYEEDKKNIEKSIKEHDKKLAEVTDDIKSNSRELGVAKESKRAIKSYTLQIFQDTLDDIGEHASQILSTIPNMTNACIFFEGCKENKSGSIKDEVNPIITMDGYDNINIKTLSGGERTVIDLAVDLAVIDMIESKAGKGADFFILDEPFEGLEDINIAECLEVLKQVDTNKKIIIVDHNPIAKEMITDKITIKRTGEESIVL